MSGKVYGPYHARLVDIHDGDTLYFDLDLGFAVFVNARDWDGGALLSCRIFGINAPELSTSAGQVSLAYAKSLLKPGDRCLVLSHGWDKYGGRFDGTVTMPDGRDFAQVMIAANMAVAI